MSDIIRQMPLADQMIDYKNLTIKPVDVGMVMLQKSGKLAKTPFAMPKFGRLKTTDDTTILSVTPDSWLIICALDKTSQTIEDYQAKVGKKNIILTDMSDQYLQFDFSGAYARALLAKGCELKLSLDGFAKNSTARTLLAHVNVVIWRGKGDDLSLFFDASFHAHLWLWLSGATEEYSKD